jgi:hypothetical protein
MYRKKSSTNFGDCSFAEYTLNDNNKDEMALKNVVYIPSDQVG